MTIEQPLPPPGQLQHSHFCCSGTARQYPRRTLEKMVVPRGLDRCSPRAARGFRPVTCKCRGAAELSCVVHSQRCCSQNMPRMHCTLLWRQENNSAAVAAAACPHAACGGTGHSTAQRSAAQRTCAPITKPTNASMARRPFLISFTCTRAEVGVVVGTLSALPALPCQPPREAAAVAKALAYVPLSAARAGKTCPPRYGKLPAPTFSSSRLPGTKGAKTPPG